MTTMLLIALLAGACGFLAGRRSEAHLRALLAPRPEPKALPVPLPVPDPQPKPDLKRAAEEADRARWEEQRKRKQAFERLLNAAGFRVHQTGNNDDGSPFDRMMLKIGDRTFSTPRGLDGVRIAYELRRHARCCDAYGLYRLAEPGIAGNEPVPGLGPTVCADCGRIEWDYDDAPAVRDIVGRATSFFPVLQAIARRDDLHADYARLAILERERARLADRAETVKLEIAQLRGRLPELPGDGPYRASPFLLPPGDAPGTEKTTR